MDWRSVLLTPFQDKLSSWKCFFFSHFVYIYFRLNHSSRHVFVSHILGMQKGLDFKSLNRPLQINVNMKYRESRIHVNITNAIDILSTKLSRSIDIPESHYPSRSCRTKILHSAASCGFMQVPWNRTLTDALINRDKDKRFLPWTIFSLFDSNAGMVHSIHINFRNSAIASRAQNIHALDVTNPSAVGARSAMTMSSKQNSRPKRDGTLYGAFPRAEPGNRPVVTPRPGGPAYPLHTHS